MEIDTNLVVLDVVTRWSIDAACSLIAAAGFLAWSVASVGVARSLLGLAVAVGVGLVIDRLTAAPRTARLADAAPLPAGAREGSALRYAIRAAIVVGVVCAVSAVIVALLGGGALAAGWFAVLGIAHLRWIVRTRGTERRERVEYQVSVGAWRERSVRYYVTSPAF